MQISWVIAGPLTRRAERIYSDQASLRYRCLIPAEILTARGHSIEFIQSDRISASHQIAGTAFGEVVIFSKSFHQINEAISARAQALGLKIVVDFCDLDYQTTPPLKQHRAILARMADRVVAASAQLAEAVALDLGCRPPIVIEDPFELPAGRARFAPEPGSLRLLWYGHPGNISDLLSIIDALADLGGEMGRLIVLEVITGSIPGLSEGFAAANRKFAGRLQLDFTAWSLDAVTRGIERADLVIVPSALDNRKKAKSANRLVEAVHGGRMVVANPIPAYAAFKDLIRLDDDIAGAIRWVLQHSESVEAGIVQGQAYIARHHSPNVIADQWESVMREIVP